MHVVSSMIHITSSLWLPSPLASLILRLFRHYVVIVGKMIQFSTEFTLVRRTAVQSMHIAAAAAAAACSSSSVFQFSFIRNKNMPLRLEEWRKEEGEGRGVNPVIKC